MSSPDLSTFCLTPNSRFNYVMLSLNIHSFIIQSCLPSFNNVTVITNIFGTGIFKILNTKTVFLHTSNLMNFGHKLFHMYVTDILIILLIYFKVNYLTFYETMNIMDLDVGHIK